ncbi:MBL fold metallo-hydrolase [Actinoplanes sp. TFC3]|uniref:MBL fold metallo-hydrolase n=1 Tax=Actinoplanes sp. TFC3 TaxID=1710355 RepID=UPI000836352D|nr:MBL fold metallo-hydrolase [Actinoplanes sp. TFC3]
MNQPVAKIALSEPFTGPLPVADPPEDMAVLHLPTGTYDTRAAFAVRGGSFFDVRHFAASAVLIQHPRGDLLIDAGFGADVDRHIALLPWYERAPHQRTSTVSDQLDAAGYDRNRLKGVVLTHAHWDHASGLDTLAGTPLWMNPGELKYAATHPGGKVYRAVSGGHRIREYTFEKRPYLGFESTFDVHGDGSVVIALAGGHTEGSVVVFVALPSGQRYAFIGDLTWQSEGIQRRVERPWLLATIADQDREQLRRGLSRVIALEDRMQIIPSHDLGSYAGLPTLATAY